LRRNLGYLLIRSPLTKALHFGFVGGSGLVFANRSIRLSAARDCAGYPGLKEWTVAVKMMPAAFSAGTVEK